MCSTHKAIGAHVNAVARCTLGGAPSGAQNLDPAVATRNASCYSRRPSPAQGLPMAAGHRITVSLECTECKRRNYSTRKNRRNSPEKINLKKYCASCKGHKPHKETK